MVDPRTLREIDREADCHLIPDCFKVSSLTVVGDEEFDNKIGSTCDEQLRKYIQLSIGDQISGKVALVGGSNRLSTELRPSKGMLAIRKPKGGTVEDWETRALGLRDGKVSFGGFVSDVVDCAGAWLSAVNSAMLVLHYLGRDISGSDFDLSRELLRKMVTESFATADDQILRPMVQLKASFDKERVKTEKLNRNNSRYFYDPLFDPGDGVFDDFPKKSVLEKDGSLIVVLPYSKCLRAWVKFR